VKNWVTATRVGLDALAPKPEVIELNTPRLGFSLSTQTRPAQQWVGERTLNHWKTT